MNEICRTCIFSKRTPNYPSDRTRVCMSGYNPKKNGHCKFYKKTDIITFVDLIYKIAGQKANSIIKTKSVEEVFPKLIENKKFYYVWDNELTPSGYKLYGGKMMTEKEFLNLKVGDKVSVNIGNKLVYKITNKRNKDKWRLSQNGLNFDGWIHKDNYKNFTLVK